MSWWGCQPAHLGCIAAVAALLQLLHYYVVRVKQLLPPSQSAKSEELIGYATFTGGSVLAAQLSPHCTAGMSFALLNSVQPFYKKYTAN